MSTSATTTSRRRRPTPRGCSNCSSRRRRAADDRRSAMLGAALRVAPASLQGLHLILHGLVEGADVVGLPHHVRRDTGAFDGRPVLGSLAAWTTCIGIEAVAEVSERVAAVMGQEAVHTMPPLAVGRVEGVEVDVAAVAVERVPRA